MVTPEQEKVFRVLDLVTKEQQDGLKTHPPTINIVAQKQEIGRGRESTHLKESQQIRVLAVYIPHDLDRSVQLNERRL